MNSLVNLFLLRWDHLKHYQLRFREMPGWDDDTQIANAFALPSGDILVTDRLMEMAGKPEELDAILLHEIGHVVGCVRSSSHPR